MKKTSKRNKTLRLLVVIILLVIIVLSAMNLFYNFYNVDIRAAQIRTASQQVELFVVLFQEYQILYGEIPDGSFSQVIEKLKNSQFFQIRKKQDPEIAETKDLWSHELKYSKRGNQIMVWSAGPNGIDDNGKEDDVVSRRTLLSTDKTISDKFSK